MVRIDRVYTRAGDDGTTALSTGARVPKDSPRVEAYGNVDELNSAIGMALALGVDPSLREALLEIQQILFDLGSDLATPEGTRRRSPTPRIAPRHVGQLERWIDGWNAELEPLKSFILPGGDPPAAQLHLARAVCRRAERSVITLARSEQVGGSVIPFLNRLSDLLFVAARLQARRGGSDELLWEARGR